MEQVFIKTSTDPYTVFVGKNNLHQLQVLLKEISPSNVLVITDTNVNELYGDSLVNLLGESFVTHKYVIQSGEAAKSFETFYEVQTFALGHQLDRKSVIVAFGGGVVGDLAGFVAATYMRGIDYIQVPTTLLAHDSAVGGKVAINHPEGKNMIGAFFQPKGVVYDISLLSTLPANELRSGFAEVVKHALIKDEEFLHILINEIQALENLNEDQLQLMVLKGIRIKADVVSTDEKELGIRAILNFGHTLGHAIEAESGYGKLSHGDSVAIGMLFATWLSQKHLKANVPYEVLQQWFSKLGFPTDIPPTLSTDALVKRMQKDKKSHANQIQMILLKNIANTTSEVFTKEQMYSLIEKWRGGPAK
ncbi:3-dehydroquinate synthase [Metabacillus herbersteinensis]|uniref:3-dehydroquinate synthase n=1 Tax=Metabacillus herbersteinensis TaxID=283816 RepID=A0ABV6GDS0_9BACI